MPFSVVIPVYNEDASIKELSGKIHAACASFPAYEIIFVNDGSTDGTRPLAEEMQNSETRFIHHEKLGKSRAIEAGVDAARHDIIITMDGDLQDDPADIPAFIKEMAQGYDVVCGWRQDRRESGAKKLASALYNRIMARLYRGQHLHDYNCGFKAFRKDVFTFVNGRFPNHRFFTVTALKTGAAVMEIPITNHPRRYGSSRFGCGKYAVFAWDLLKYIIK